MMRTASHYGYGSPSWTPAAAPGPHGGAPPWDGPWRGPWNGPPEFRSHLPAAGRAVLRRIAHGGPLWIVATVLGFLVWWPVGLGLLLFGLGRRHMGCGRHRRWAMAACGGATEGGQAGRWAGWGMCRGSAPEARSSGNHAFDEYRADTLRRLEEEQKEFATFLERLRFAKDKAEFDAFVAERRQPPQAPPAEPAEG